MAREDIIRMVITVGLCLGVGFIAGRFEPGQWYRELAKPSWTPPGWIFAPVWITLYILMGLAAWLVWRKAGMSAAAIPLAIFLIQLLLNGLWSYIFFGRHEMGLAFAEIIILWAFILVTMILFWQRQNLAGIFILPYFLWVSFAAFLNYSIWQLNK